MACLSQGPCTDHSPSRPDTAPLMPAGPQESRAKPQSQHTPCQGALHTPPTQVSPCVLRGSCQSRLRGTAGTPFCTASLEDSDCEGVSSGRRDGGWASKSRWPRRLPPAPGAWERGGVSNPPTPNPAPPQLGGLSVTCPAPASLDT